MVFNCLKVYLAIQISCPYTSFGSISIAINKNIIQTENIYKSGWIGISHFYDGRSFYPELPLSGFNQAYEWILGFGDDLFIREPKTRIERALYAFTNCFSEYDNVERIVWMLVFLESLFTSSNTGVMEQIREKYFSYVGRLDGFKKKINDMYAFRSSFYHGSLSFDSKLFKSADIFGETDISYSETKFLKGEYDAIATGAYLMLTSLQKLVMDGRYDLEFKIEAI